MADTYTTNLNLTKPEPGAAEDTWGISLNDDLDTLDAIFSSSGTQINLNPNQVNFADNKKAIFGTDSDLQIYHDGGNSYIRDLGTGNLRIDATDFYVRSSSGTQLKIGAVDNGAVNLYYAGSKKLATTSTGIDVTGTVTSDGLEARKDTGSTTNSLLKLTNSAGSTTDGVGITFEVANTSGAGGSVNVVRDGSNFKPYMTLNTSANVSTAPSQRVRIDDTGIDVTGSVTADTLDVDNVKILSAQSSTVTNDVAALIYRASSHASYANGDLIIQARSSASRDIYFLTGSTTPVNRMQINGNGDISFYDDTGTTQGLFWDASAESLSIGATSTAGNAKFYVKNGSSGQSYSNVSGMLIDVNGTSNSYYGLRVGSSTGNSHLAVTNAGNVAIGTDNPASLLHLKSSTPDLRIQSDNGQSASLTFGDASDSTRGGIEYTSTDDIVFKNNNMTEQMRIRYTGNVGIGTSNPTKSLYVKNTSSQTVAVFDGGNNSAGEIAFVNSSTSGDTYVTVGAIGDDMSLSAGANERVRIKSDGSVGIGTNSPSGELHVVGTSGGNGDVYVGRTLGAEIHTQAQSALGVFGTSSNHDLAFKTNGTQRLRIDTSGNVGIGTSSPNSKLHVSDATAPTFRLSRTGTGQIWQQSIDSSGRFILQEAASEGGTKYTRLAVDDDGNVGIGTGSPDKALVVEGNSAEIVINDTDTTDTPTLRFRESGTTAAIIKTDSQNLIFTSGGGSEKARIDSSGHLLVGTTSTSPSLSNVTGIALRNEGHIYASRDGGVVAYFNRITNGGTILDFRKDGANVGSIGTSSGNLTISGKTNKAGLYFSGDNITPMLSNTRDDNEIDLGTATFRFQDIYATNGTIQTSDINEKQDIEDLSEAETRVAVAAKGLLKKYRWKSAVADKGDDARIHFGIMAQDLENAFANEGLDAGDYGMFISSTWTDEATGEEKTRLGVRYNELLAFIIAAI